MSKGRNIGMTIVDDVQFDPAAIRKAEAEELAQRSEEESGPVTTGVHPVYCVKQGLPLERAARMRPEDLTPADAKLLVSKGVTLAAIADLYFAGNSVKALEFLTTHGVKKKNGMPEYPWTGVTVVQEADAATPAIALDIADDTAAPAREPESLAPADLTREQAARLLAQGVTKPQIQQMYGFKNAAALYYKLERLGLHKRQPQGDKHDPEEAKRMAAAVLQEIEEEKSAPQLNTEQLDRFDDLKPRQPTEPELREMFEEPEPSPAPAIDLSTWQPVESKQHQAPYPVLRLSARGDGAIVATTLTADDRVMFLIDPASEGRRIAIVKSADGKKLTLEKETRHRLKYTNMYLMRALQERGIAFPAAYKLEWNDGAGAWIGELVEKGAEAG
jgi:hypothetical protein